MDFCIFFGRYWGGQKLQKLKSILIKTRVGFGRIELSLSLSCTEFRALSHGHGFRGPCFKVFAKVWFFMIFGPFLLTMFLTLF